MSESTQTVAFHSFRGTAGRSTALANVSHALAERGETVGCIDLDLASPVLHTIFPHIGKKHANKRQIHDHLKGYEGDIEDYIIDVGDAFDRNDAAELDGELHLISGKVTQVDEESPIDITKKAIELQKEFKYEENLDYLLLNTTPGLTYNLAVSLDNSNMCLMFHEWTHPDRTGTRKILDWIDEVEVGFDNFVSVANNVPKSVDESDIEDWVNSELNPYGVSEHHIINSSGILENGEEIVTVENPESEVADQYRSLADSLTE